MPHARQTLGQRGEDFVAAELRRTGYTILARNWRHGAHGELDIVARYGESPDEQIVFVEVRTRRGPTHAAIEVALASVDERKRAQLLRLAEAFLDAHDLDRVEWRITLAAVGYDRGRFTLEVIKDAVEW
jgi:putative endonuclease